MKLPALTREQVRSVDQMAIQQYGMPGIVLMENAGRGAAEVIHEISPTGRVVILCGGGNNGGDGYVIARHLQLAGRDVRIVSLVEPTQLRGDALVNAGIAKHGEIEVRVADEVNQITRSIEGSAVIVDALLGTGATGPLRPRYAECVSAANDYASVNDNVIRVAIDVPTGLDCDTGLAADAVFQAEHTITFVARKIGFEKPNAAAYLGVVHEIGIGVPQKLLKDLV